MLHICQDVSYISSGSIIKFARVKAEKATKSKSSYSESTRTVRSIRPSQVQAGTGVSFSLHRAFFLFVLVFFTSTAAAEGPALRA